MQFLRTNTYPPGLNTHQKKACRRKAGDFEIVNSLLCFKIGSGRFKRAVFEFKRDIIQIVHTEEHLPAHIGIDNMVDIVHRKYYGIPSSVINTLVKNCETCARSNTLTTVEDKSVNIITSKFDGFMMDCVDLRRYASDNENYSWILNVMDTTLSICGHSR
jgi:hypothetical protein